MNIPGEKFDLNLDDLDEDVTINENAARVMNFVSDIVEKPTTNTPTAPVAPSLPNSSGFPAHKKRIPKGPSRFKQRAQAAAASQQAQPTERQSISQENERRIASMSAEKIEEERRELMEKLSPGLIERLLKRATLDDPDNKQPSEEKPDLGSTMEELKAPEPLPTPSVASKPDPIPKPPKKTTIDPNNYDPDNAAPPIYDESLFPKAGSYHFPTPPQPDDMSLDPSSPEFLEAMHKKYFPNLPSDPSKLAWMTPVSEREDMSAYHPEQADVLPSALRFDFRGEILPPRKARELPAHLGLHHHSEAPNAAGYTIPELARLARSTFPAQRCMAMQTLGRILFKLGSGVYKVAEIENGLWRCIEEGKVLATLEETANAKSGHLSVKSYATEALWLWQKGGGKRVQAQ